MGVEIKMGMQQRISFYQLSCLLIKDGVAKIICLARQAGETEWYLTPFFLCSIQTS